MRIWKFTKYGKASEVLKEFNEPKPQAQAGEVLVKLQSASINPVDYKIIQGKFKMVQRRPLPSAIGYDFAGEIIELGSGVVGYEIGDKIFGCLPANRLGTISEFFIATDRCFAKLPRSSDLDLYAPLPLAGMTALQCFWEAKLNKGDKVLIHAGSGGVGSLAIQIAKAMNYNVTTTTSSKNSIWVKELGADRVICYDKEDYKELSNEFDMVLDSLGGQYGFDAAIVLKKGGVLVNIAGGIDENAAKRLGVPGFIRWLIKLQRRKLRKHLAKKDISYRYVLMQTNEKDLTALRTLVEQGKLKAVVEEKYSWEQAPEAFAHLMTSRTKGKLLISSANY
ncbi:MAG: NAD(P)-dependent alcohol dehydrogenase [Bacteroidia bacterium]